MPTVTELRLFAVDLPFKVTVRHAAETALKRLASPAEIADAILYLASPRASYVTGAVLSVDGGSTAGR